MLLSTTKALESCISPFLDQCDKDKNDFISDEEWGICLDLSNGNIFKIYNLNFLTMILASPFIYFGPLFLPLFLTFFL